ARVKGHPTSRAINQLRRGIVLDDGPTYPAQVRWIRTDGADAWIEITIHEGRNRQVRRMFEKVGHPVLALQRVSFGPITLGALEPGQYRYLDAGEIRALKRAVFLND